MFSCKYIYIFIIIFYYATSGVISEASVPKYKELGNCADYEYKALELANRLIDKLKSNTRFTIEDERNFFGGTANPYSYTSAFYQKFGYVRYVASNNNMKDIILKPLPKYSFFGETLRLYKNFFFNEGTIPVLSLGKTYYTNTENKLQSFDDEYIYVYIQSKPNNSNIVRLCYSKKHGFFIEDIYINGRNIFMYLNLTQNEDDTNLNPQFMDMMHEYIK